MIYWITLPIAGLALLVIIVTIARHWKEIRLLNPDSIKEEQQRQKRERIIEQRFERVRSDAFTPLKRVFQTIFLKGKKAFHAAYIRLIQLDRFYKQAKAPFAHMAPSLKDRIRTLLDEARALARDLKWADAERRFLEILTLDDRNIDAYKGLAAIYVKQKLYPQAIETYQFLVKIKKADASCFEGLGDIAVAQDDPKAEGYYQKAIELQPRVAHQHAVLAHFYLSHAQPLKAWPVAKRASELESKSAKFLELSLEAAIQAGEREEARRRYDALRLQSEDRQKLQTFKDRIDNTT